MSKYKFEVPKYEKELRSILSQINDVINSDDFENYDLEKFRKEIEKILKKHPKDGSKLFSRDQLIAGIDWFIESKEYDDLEDNILERIKDNIKMKPTRTISGVTTVTVLTKPFACPGECIFCPNDVRMPKSYIANEPGAQRALMNRFSPYLQTWNRRQALKNIGHPTEKIELLVLGGTWSFYSEKYQIWFIKECFRAMNEFGLDSEGAVKPAPDTVPVEPRLHEQTAANVDEYKTDSSGFKYEGEKIYLDKYFESDWNDELREQVGDLPYNKLIQTKEFHEHFNQYICSEDSALPPKKAWVELYELHETNSHSKCRCVGMVLETRPDSINEREALRLRKLGATKIQLGIQTLDDKVSEMNKRGEGRAETSKAFELLRAAGFKIHAHMMPNLYGATPELDKKVYDDLFTDLPYKPDEVKIYPTSVIKHTELYDLYEQGKYRPYETDELVDLVADMMEMTPEYCRLTRIIRDIPSTEIEAGNKTTNLRQVVEWKLKNEQRSNPNIRAREIKNESVTMDDLSLDIIEYETTYTNEYFLQYITKERKIAGFLRLSLPKIEMRDERLETRGEGAVKLAPDTVPVEPRLQRISEYTNPVTSELDNCAMIREIHVYGPSLELTKTPDGEAQHLGLGTKLIEKAKEITIGHGFTKLAVISSIGTREYYDKRGFKLDEYYQIWEGS